MTEIMTYGYCVYHELECDFIGQCRECPHNSAEDIKWFEQDEENETEVTKTFSDN